MQSLKYFCNACGKECQPQEGKSTFGGIISRLNVKLERQPYQFMQDFCVECSEIILNFISELKKDIKDKADKNKK